MFPLRGIGTIPFPSACAAPCAQAAAGSEAIVAPDTAVLIRSRRVKLFIADRVYPRSIILQTFSQDRPSHWLLRSWRSHVHVGATLVSPFRAPSVYALNRGVPVKMISLPLAVALCPLVALPVPAAEKPAMFRGNPEHTGVY